MSRKSLPLWLMGVRLSPDEVWQISESIPKLMPLEEGKKLFATKIQNAMYEKVIRGLTNDKQN